MSNELLSKEETLKEIGEMMEFLKELSDVYQSDPESFPADLLQNTKKLIAKGIEFCGGLE